MPSKKDPNAVVNPGSGKVPAGSVPISALMFSGGGSGGGDLAAHLADPVDAHMAWAIGIPETDPVTGAPLLVTAAEAWYDNVFDGQNVLDALTMLKDLLPPRPNRIGWDDDFVSNSGVPSWGDLDAISGLSYVGAWTDGTNAFRPSRAIVDNAVAATTVSGTVFPADRGVIALYHSTDSTFNTGTTTLISALWLGSSPAPAGIPDAAFSELGRKVAQPDYTPTGVGIDKVTLTWRLPYKKEYGTIGVPYTDFTVDFPRWQLATYQMPLTVALGDAGAYLVVHWREGFATTLAAIQTFVHTNVTDLNCYSMTPNPSALIPAGETKWDVGWVANVAKRNIYRDAGAIVLISPTITQTAPSGTTTYLSGLPHYTADFTTNFQADITGLFGNSHYRTGTVANPPDVPPDFLSAEAPVRLKFTEFGSTEVIDKAYTDLVDGGLLAFNSTTNVPLPADTARLGPIAGLTIPYGPSEAGVGPELVAIGGVNSPTSAARIEVQINGGFIAQSPTKVIFNSFPQSGGSTQSTETYEPFVDEKFRVNPTYALTASDPFPPTGGADFDSNLALAANAGGPMSSPKSSLQVVGGRLVYPHFNFSTGYIPAGPDYNAVFLADIQNAQRMYVRAFNTGIPRSTGRLRIKGLAFNDFKATGAVSGSSGNFADHAGKAVVSLYIPGATGFLDLGRYKGDPDLSTTDWRGCLTGINPGGSLGDTYEYDMTGYTQDNGSGKFLIYLLIVFVKQSPAGSPVSTGATEYLYVDELEWLPPV